MSAPDCLLCRVARGELPARMVIETERIVGVMNDAEAFARGHMVFFPRRHAERLTAMNDDELGEILLWVKRAAEALGASDYNLLQNNGSLAGQTVMHAHFHLIPKWSADEGLVYRREPRHGLDHGDVHAIVRTALARHSS